MTERTTLPPTDDEFEAALRARRRLVPRFETPLDDAAEPSPELDRLVLARARDALRLASPPERHYRSPRWAVPVGLAATVLLAIGLVTQMDPTRNDAVLATGGDTTASRAVTTRAVAEAETATAVPAQEAAPRLAEPAASAARVAPAVPAERRVTRTEEFVADASAEATRTEVDSTATSIANSREQAVAPSSAARSAAGRASANATAGASAAKAAPMAPTLAAAPPLAPPPAPIAAPAPAAAPAADAMARAAGAGAGAGATEDDARMRAALPRDDPQRWLAAIEQLQRSGDLDAARTELVAFRRRHPEQALPETLERLLH